MGIVGVLVDGRPAAGPSQCVQPGLGVVVVKDRQLQRVLFEWIGFSQDLPSPIGVHHVEVSLPDHDCFVRQSDHPLDVIDVGLFGELEDRHIPAFWLSELKGELVDQDPVTLEDWQILDVVLVSTVGAVRRRDTGSGFVPVVLQFLAGSHRVIVSTGLAINVLVPAIKCRGHRPGGNHESLGLEGLEDKSQDEGDRKRLDRLAPPTAAFRLVPGQQVRGATRDRGLHLR